MVLISNFLYCSLVFWYIIVFIPSYMISLFQSAIHSMHSTIFNFAEPVLYLLMSDGLIYSVDHEFSVFWIIIDSVVYL